MAARKKAAASAKSTPVEASSAGDGPAESTLADSVRPAAKKAKARPRARASAPQTPEVPVPGAGGPADTPGQGPAPASRPASASGGNCLSLAQKRRLAKDAMWASLAVLTVTAFTGAHKRGLSRTLHLGSGAALLGLALWHHSLYSRKKAAECPAEDL